MASAVNIASDASAAIAGPSSGSSNTGANASSSKIAAHPRHAYARAILGNHLSARLANARILVVGAGGIGCELLKNLVLVGVGHIDIIDLDTIDLSNLNRQFLFQKQHIGKPKSLVAAATALQFNPLVDIRPFHANVKDTKQFGWEYFEQFDVVCNALDNLDARRWVNKMCVMTGVPLIESGTTGFLGQVQPIQRGVSECYDCTAKPTPRAYPVCTIRSTPSTPIHCVVWAKTYLFTQLFGAEDENEDAELDKALQDGENAEEIANLRKEAKEMRSIRDAVFAVRAEGSEEDLLRLSKRVFNKVFRDDVERLLGMDDMWRNRTRPVPLDFDKAQAQESHQSNGDAGSTSALNGNGAAAVLSQAPSHSLRDQRVLSLRETVEEFNASLARLARRAGALEQTVKDDGLAFDKDDVDAMDFVTATSNLRSRIYHIAPQSRFQVKEMAGNIIPAIASTNAIIAGAQVLQTFHALRRLWTDARFVSLNRNSAGRLVTSITLGLPNAACGVCQDDYIRARMDVESVTLGQIKAVVLQSRDEGGIGYEVEGLELFESARLLADEDFDNNLERSLSSLGITLGSVITCADEDGKRATLNIYIAAPLDAMEDNKAIDLGPADKLPTLRMKPTLKRSREESEDEGDDDDVQEVERPTGPPPPKRKRSLEDSAKRDDNPKSSEGINGASAKRARLPAATGAREEDAIELD